MATPSKRPAFLRGTWQVDWALLVVLACALAYGAVLSHYSILKHETLHSSAYDLGLIEQTIWNTSRGHWFETSMLDVSRTHPTYLGDHLSFVFAPLALLYVLWSDVRLLLVFQSFCIGFGAVALYWLGRLRLGSAGIAAALAIAYLLYPTLSLVNLFDYHPDTFLVVLVPLAFHCIFSGRRRAFLLVVAAMLLLKEDTGLTVGMLGLYAALRHRWHRLGLAVACLGFVYFALALQVIIPFFHGGTYRFVGRYSHLGGSAGEIAANLLLNPSAVAALLTQPDRLIYLAYLFAPTLGLALLAPFELAVASPLLAGNLLSNWVVQRTLGYQYSLVIVAVIFVAVIEALRTLSVRLARHSSRIALRHTLAGAILVVSWGFAFFSNAITYHQALGDFTPPANHAAFREAAARVPAAASLTTTNAFAPHFTHRRDLQLIAPREWRDGDAPVNTEYVLVDLGDDAWTEGAGMRSVVARLVDPTAYVVIYSRDDIVLYRRAGL